MAYGKDGNLLAESLDAQSASWAFIGKIFNFF